MSHERKVALYVLQSLDKLQNAGLICPGSKIPFLTGLGQDLASDLSGFIPTLDDIVGCMLAMVNMGLIMDHPDLIHICAAIDKRIFTQ